MKNRTNHRGWRLKAKGVCVCFALAAVSLPATAQVNVLTANYDNRRTNSNLHETALNPQTVNVNSFGKIGTFPVDGAIYAQALYMSGVQNGGQTRNVVYVATMHNSVYAIDADAPQSTTPLWRVNLGPSISSAVFNFTDILPEVGILSTPVIDPARGVIYVVSDTLEDSGPVFRLHALSLSDGSEAMNGPVVISASVPGTGRDSDDDGALCLDPLWHLQRPGLALTNGAVYVAFGSHADIGPWHGWLISYDASDLQQQLAVFNTSPNGVGSSIWQAGRAPAIDDQGDIYAVTGNGDYDGQSAFGESVLHLSASMSSVQDSGAVSPVVDWFTPDNWNDLNNADRDLGSTGPILLAENHQLLAGSKAGVLYLVPTDSMGQGQPGGAAGVQAAQVNQHGIFDIALWQTQKGPTVYVAEPLVALKSFQISNGRINAAVSSQFPISSMFVGVAVSASGGADGTGIVWLTTADQSTSAGTLHALNASDLSQELWNSAANASRDGLGRFAKFVAPTVANGKVYVPTFSNSLVIYGLLNGNAGQSSPPQVTSIVNGASLLGGGTVAPGEYVAIFGANLGTSATASMTLDAGGRVSTSLSGTQVFFDGAPAPVISASANEVDAMVPFSVSGPSTNVQVAFGGLTSPALTVPVAAAAPSMFWINASVGQAGVFNQDGSPNAWYNPAHQGSTVTFYATGGGVTTPASLDGAITSSSPYPIPLLLATATIDGQNVPVMYAGAAPGNVAGILRVDVLIPETVWGYNLQLLLNIGDYSSPNALTISVQ